MRFRSSDWASALEGSQILAMHILIIHSEPRYFGGAERMLNHFLEGIASAGPAVTVAAARDSAVAQALPASIRFIAVEDDRRFSAVRLFRNAAGLARVRREIPFDVLHGWSARDWELTALAGRITGCPAVGTLHDHPSAGFISAGRRRLMRWSARLGLAKIICVSEAVRRACVSAGYRGKQLEVIRNGLPAVSMPPREAPSNTLRLGFLGVFLPRKGFRGLFEILDQFARVTDRDWEILIGGGAQDDEGKKLAGDIEREYRDRAWWPRVHWCGWIRNTGEFMSGLDLLVCPSSEFDPFPTVLLEAGQAGTAVLASRVGGVEEIVRDGETGWLFAAGEWAEAARKLAEVSGARDAIREAGIKNARRVLEEFSIGKMIARHLRLYSNIAPHV